MGMVSGALFGLNDHDAVAIAFWLIGLAGVAVVEWVRRDGSRITPAQTRCVSLLWILSATLVLMRFLPGAPDIGIARLVGLALSPIPFIAIAVLESVA